MADINALLRLWPPDCQPSRLDALGNAGGMSGAQFWRVRAMRGGLVLRRWPAEHPSPERLRFIHAVIEHAGRTLDFLPVPIRTQHGDTFVDADDHLWELTTWMPGTADYERMPNEEKLRAAMTALAQVHNATADFPRNPEQLTATSRVAEESAVQRRISRLQELTPTRIQKLHAAIDRAIWPELAPIARQFLARLPQVIPPALESLHPLAKVVLPVQPCLRDIWHDHVLFTGNKVTGLIDFGAITIDTPTTDIARLLGSLAGASGLPFRERPLKIQERSHVWQIGLAAYSATRPPSDVETRAVIALNAANPILAGYNWINWLYVERREFESRPQILMRFQRILAELTH